jgi:hypothetical protein
MQVKNPVTAIIVMVPGTLHKSAEPFLSPRFPSAG